MPETSVPAEAQIYFSERFGVDPATLEAYGALDISVVTDMPLFIDPFLLFNSEKADYQALHNMIIEYLRFLRSKAAVDLDPQLIQNWYRFKEVRQNWLGFTADGNGGHALGKGFATALHESLGSVLGDFGDEEVTQSSHLEKLALIRGGVGKDSISDFATNLIKHFLLEYTQTFATEHLDPSQCQTFHVARAAFNYQTESWATRDYVLPEMDGDFVLLTPLDLLTKDDTWINRTDMVRSFDQLPAAVEDAQQRALINNYLQQQLSSKPSDKELADARARTLAAFPELIDLYIKLKEDAGDQAAASSLEKAEDTQRLLRDQVQAAAADLAAKTDLYSRPQTSSYDEARTAVATFKTYVEDQDGYQLINRGDGTPFASEKEVQSFFGLLLQRTRFDVNREPNNGRGPVDFKISSGAHDKALIEFKLAKSSSLRRNLQNQVAIYEKANGTHQSVKVIICYTEQDKTKVTKVLKDLDLAGDASIVVIDARSDNKPSASKA